MDTLYFAYGSNCNTIQMARRCPTAVIIGTAKLKGWALKMRAHADIEPKEGAEVVGTLWVCRPNDMKALDYYEGVPSYYTKKEVTVEFVGGEKQATVYVMTEAKSRQKAYPSRQYISGIISGYKENKIPLFQLQEALYRMNKMQIETIRVIVVEPSKEWQLKDIENTLHTMQKIVGGYIEVVQLCDGVALICDEDGKLKGKPVNETQPAYFMKDKIAGTYIICGANYDDEEFTSITDEQWDFLRNCKFERTKKR